MIRQIVYVTRMIAVYFFYIFFIAHMTSEIYTLSLHDALPICVHAHAPGQLAAHGDLLVLVEQGNFDSIHLHLICFQDIDRKSTRLNSSHLGISYAVFCLKKKKIYYTS